MKAVALLDASDVGHDMPIAGEWENSDINSTIVYAPTL